LCRVAVFVNGIALSGIITGRGSNRLLRLLT
jgi:hypothetical protein